MRATDIQIEDDRFADFIVQRARVEAIVETLAIVGQVQKRDSSVLGLFFRVLDLLKSGGNCCRGEGVVGDGAD